MNREEIKFFLSEKFKSDKLISSYQTIKNKNKDIYNSIVKNTSYLNDCTFNERLYHIVYDLYEVPKCGNNGCNNESKFSSFNKGYSKYCSLPCANENIKGILYDNRENILCSYGCGNIAKYLIFEDKPCCSKLYNKCPSIRKKNSIKNKGENNAMYGKKSANRYSLSDIKEKFPKFCSTEELKEDENGNILVKCSVCKKWYIADKENFKTRKWCLENDLDKSRFYCSDDCKMKCSHYRQRCDPEELKKYHKYQRLVWKITNFNLRKYGHLIENLQNRKRKYKLSLDHKLSIREGFNNDISPEIVGHIKNLEIMTTAENSSKGKNSSITKESLINIIEQFKKEQN